MHIANVLQTFSNGQDVIDLVQTELNQLQDVELKEHVQPIRLLLLDINMPAMDGFETLKKVKQLFEDQN